MRNEYLSQSEKRSFFALVSLILFAFFACLATDFQATRDIVGQPLAVWATLSVALSFAFPPLLYLIAVASDSVGNPDAEAEKPNRESN